MAFICCSCCCRVCWISCSWIFSCPTGPTWGVGPTGKFWRLNLKEGDAMLFCNVFADGESCIYQQLIGPFQQFSPALIFLHALTSCKCLSFLCIIKSFLSLNCSLQDRQFMRPSCVLLVCVCTDSISPSCLLRHLSPLSS